VSIVLASASPARHALLREAGVAFDVQPAAIDEAEVKTAYQRDNRSAADLAIALAELKALRISARHPEALVVGADQILLCGDVRFDKPPDLDHAKAQLIALRGKTHELVTAVLTVRDGARLWHRLERPKLTMRPFSDEFLETYLTEGAVEALESVGGYRLEGRGAQLFSRVEGDYFSVLGLPLLPLLDHLRLQGELPA
jgi:septum formation protein